MLIAEAIGLGLVVSLLFTEAVGFAAGGFVSFFCALAFALAMAKSGRIPFGAATVDYFT